MQERTVAHLRKAVAVYNRFTFCEPADAEKWHNTALKEFGALLENGTFEPVQLPAGRRAIGCRWVFKLKCRADGSVGYKARLVAKGFSQCPGLDFGQVFAPTARWAALRAIFALAAI